MEALAKVIEAVAHLIGVLAWPVVAVFFVFRFGQPVRDFLSNLGEGSFKVLGVEASGKRRGEAAAAMATAAVAKLEAKSGREQTAPPTIQEITSLINKSLQTANLIITTNSIRKAKGKFILWVDDNPNNNTYERTALEALGFNIWTASSTEEALQIFRHAKHADIIISDMRRPEGEKAGVDLLAKLYKDNIYKPYIIYSGYSTDEEKADLKNRGAFGVTTDANELIEIVLQALNFNSVFD